MVMIAVVVVYREIGAQLGETGFTVPVFIWRSIRPASYASENPLGEFAVPGVTGSGKFGASAFVSLAGREEDTALSHGGLGHSSRVAGVKDNKGSFVAGAI